MSWQPITTREASFPSIAVSVFTKSLEDQFQVREDEELDVGLIW